MRAARPQAAAREGRYAVRRRPDGPGRIGVLRRVGLVVGIAILAGALYWLLSSRTFAVTRVESGSYRFTTEDELQLALADLLGRNIWTLSRSEISEKLAPLPWVRDLEVRRRLPATLKVDFREWEPILQVAAAGADQRSGPLVMRPDGSLEPFPAHLPAPGLPVLTGLEPVREGDGGGWRLPPDKVAEILELVAAMEDAGLETVCPVDFVVARPEGYGIVLQDRQGTLLVGREDFLARLERFVVARDRLEPGIEVDLRFENRLTVRSPSD